MKKKRYFVYYDKVTMCLTHMFGYWVICFCIYYFIKNRIYDGNLSLIFDNFGVFCLISIPLILVLSAIYAIYRSEMVSIEDESMCFYRYIFSKEPYYKIPITDDIHFVISHGLWKKARKAIMGRKVFVFNRNDIVKTIELHAETLLEIYSSFDRDKIEVIGDDCHTMSINKFFRIDFYSLTDEQKLLLLKRYCHVTKSDEMDGEELLKKKKLL